MTPTEAEQHWGRWILIVIGVAIGLAVAIIAGHLFGWY